LFEFTERVYGSELSFLSFRYLETTTLSLMGARRDGGDGGGGGMAAGGFG
jgi:hypothetical protein